MKRTLSFLLAAVMAAAALVCPAAAVSSAPWAQVSGGGSASQSVTLQGLSEQYNGVQLTLTLNSAPSGVAFVRSGSDEQTHFTYTLEGNQLTLYVTSKAILNQGSSLSLGTLSADAAFTVSAVSGLKLLRVEPNDTTTVSYDIVHVTNATAQGSGSTPSQGNIGTNPGQGSGSNPNPGQLPGGGVLPPTQPETLPFDDVRQGDWFREAVDYVYQAGLMNGTGTASFSPGGTTTRGMIVTILHRYEGEPAAPSSGFRDVAPEQYYAGAVSWAAATGVVNGIGDGLFGPNRMITREQMAAILYRYAQSKGLDVSGKADLSAYTDAGQISAYAVDAMAWARHIGLIAGVDDRTLQPGGTATRAQVAVILMRFCKYAEGK